MLDALCMACESAVCQLFQQGLCRHDHISLQHTFTVSASAELGASPELLLSPGPLPIKKLTSRSLSQLLPPSACMTNTCRSVWHTQETAPELSHATCWAEKWEEPT